MQTTTIALAAPRTANAPALFSIFDGDEIGETAVRPAAAIRALRARGLTVGQALAAIRVATEKATGATFTPVAPVTA